MLNKTEQQRIISVPDTGHGNPTTFWALIRQIPELKPIFLRYSGWLAQQAHSVMSTNIKTADDYTQNSEATRISKSALIFARVMFEEFIMYLRFTGNHEDAFRVWLVVQEHALLGATPERLKRHKINEVNLVVPDVYPKDSGIKAIERISEDHEIETAFTVWNRQAYEHLLSLGFSVELVAPFILDGFLNDDGFRSVKDREVIAGKPQVVVKSSGSGMPHQWMLEIKKELIWSDVSYEIHLPYGYYDNNGLQKVGGGKEGAVSRFYESLSDQTQIIISPPSEIVQVAADLRQRDDSSVILLALPPRGQHEVKSLEWAYKAGLCPGVLDIVPGKTFVKGIPKISLSDISYYMSKASGRVSMELGNKKVS